MNPFLESAELWSEFHSRMIVAIADTLHETISQDYRIAVEKPVQERYLEIREIATRQVITVIELLSPKNKQAGIGRDTYLQKRQHIMMSQTHLVEIDLLRAGEPLPIVGAVPSHYRILVSVSPDRPKAQLYAFNLPQPIPQISIPLASGTAVSLDLQVLLHQVYDRARFSMAIDYQNPPTQKLSASDKAWLTETLSTTQPPSDRDH